MLLEVNENLFDRLWPYIQDGDVTDIKWNGSALWINNLKKGRYRVENEDGTPFKLDTDWINIFCSKVANSVNENFNISEPSLKAETDELRIQAEHSSVTGDGTVSFTIRKTPKVSRLGSQNLIENGYLDELTYRLLPCLMRGRCSGIITGDVGAGKTELEKYLIKFIPEVDGIVTVEDTLEMKIKALYPSKDVISMRVTDFFTNEMAIRDSLRMMCKWLILSEARGREIVQVMEGASTGCVALTSIHAENAWEIPDRIMNMAGDDARKGFENDVFTFFDYAIKVAAEFTNDGIHRKIDQICFFDRDNKENKTAVFMKDGKLTGEKIPNNILHKFLKNQKDSEFDKYEKEFFIAYKEKIKKEEIED